MDPCSYFLHLSRFMVYTIFWTPMKMTFKFLHPAAVSFSPDRDEFYYFVIVMHYVINYIARRHLTQTWVIMSTSAQRRAQVSSSQCKCFPSNWLHSNKTPGPDPVIISSRFFDASLFLKFNKILISWKAFQSRLLSSRHHLPRRELSPAQQAWWRSGD